MPGPGQLPGPLAGHPGHLRHRLRRSSHPPSPHAYQHLCFSTAFVPMSFIFQYVGEPVSGRDARPGTAPRTLRGASRPSQASSEDQPSPHAYKHLCFSTAFVPMSFIFQFVGGPVSGGDARPGTAPRTLRGASRPSQASSEAVQGPAKHTRIPAPLFQ